MSFPPTGSRCYGDEGIIDLGPYMQEALEYVVDIILLYGQFPRPSIVERPQFDLYEWLENMEHDLREFAFAMTLDLDRFRHSEILDAWREKVRGRLMDELANSSMVLDEAERLREGAT
ncbi:hypothetical protein [Sphingomonas sp.]|uniref:hypothetical protein n=1 Tax=Sphingomonas sp. TaxID=28214 RepID=UPI0025E958F7|nr:hypothetical protein [Sphingomonas sp.]